MPKSRLRRAAQRHMNLLINRITGSGLAQEENEAFGPRTVTPGMPEALRALASEGIVLLKNENQALPLQQGQTVAVFGRTQCDWFYVGYGSGGDVHPPYTVSFFDGLEEAGIRWDTALQERYAAWVSQPDNAADHGYWGHWPYSHEEMPLEAALVEETAQRCDTALCILGRAAGEDRENRLAPGSYYLTEEERNMLALVRKAFSKVILLMDCGNIIDMAFTQEYNPDAIVYAWQLGQENGHAVADILSGRVTPSGKLADTIAKSYDCYPSSANFGRKAFNRYAEDIYVGYRYFSTFAPDQVLWPFGFGLSYTRFQLEDSVTEDAGALTFRVTVTNQGDRPGKETVQIYIDSPNGSLGNPRRRLVGYRKTGLLAPGASETVTITVTEEDFACYDADGVTGHKDCFVVERGWHTLLLGTDSTTDRVSYLYVVPETRVVRQCREVCCPAETFPVLNPLGSGSIRVSRAGPDLPAAPFAPAARDLKQRILENLPPEITPTGDKGILLSDVKAEKAGLEAFIAQLTDEELVDLTRGEGGMGSSLGTPGNAGAFGGITPALRQRGIPPILTADGPAGLRVRRRTTLLPCGTAIACAWNPELTQQVFTLIGQEAAGFGIDVLLSPGLNIHRDPLCGRNFEYYSEDPLLSGRTAAAAVRGIQAGGTSACPKHFACNNQEVNRNHNDSRVSIRALREIYLKNFEYCVKEGRPQNIMTSYNKLNGVWNHYNYDLVTTVLRQEWGYGGNVVTDWWMRRAKSPEFPALRDNAYRTRAQVDVLMPGCISPLQHKYRFDKALRSALRKGLTRGELQRAAANVLRFALTRIK